MSEVRILSVDGGGIRGLVSAIVLHEFEKRLPRPLHEYFNMRAGASTGGIVQVCLSPVNGQPLKTANDMIELYQKRGPEIFSRSLFHRVKSGGGWFDEKYQTEKFEKIIKEVVGDRWLSEVEDDLFIPARDLNRRWNHYFQSWSAREGNDPDPPETWDYKLSDVVRGCTAAPTYFEPHICANRSGKDTFRLTDGGIFANNPASTARSMAFGLYGPSPDYFILSIGSGSYIAPIDAQYSSEWGKLGWVLPIVDEVFDAVSQNVDIELGKELGTNFVRLQGSLNRNYPGIETPNGALDDASPKNIERLTIWGNYLVKQWEKTIDQVCERLTKTPTLTKETLLQETKRCCPCPGHGQP